jgi:uncharacterized protein
MYGRAIITIGLGLLVSACETTPRYEEPTRPEITIVTTPNAQIPETTGEIVDPAAIKPQYDPIILAQNKINEARYLTGELKSKTQLEAAELLMDSGRTLSSSNVLSEISQAALSITDQQTYRILQSTALYRNQNYDSAWRDVQTINLQVIESNNTLQKFWRLRGFLEYRQGRIANSINSLIHRESYLSDRRSLSQNHEQIRVIIESLNAEQIAQLNSSNLSPQVLNRITASYQNNNNSAYPPPYDPTYPNTELGRLPQKLLQTPSWPINAPRNIALLLPLSSRFSSSADEVEQGFRTAHSNDPSPFKPNIQLVDTGADTSLTGRYYENAVNSGVEFIVGPLGREAARYVSSIASGTTQTLMLGTPDSPTYRPSKNLTHFDFSPENEARAVAEKIYSDGHRSIVTFHPNQNWSSRYLESFRDEWQRLGGKITREQVYYDGAVDFSREIRNLLGIDLSERRKTTLQSALGANIQFQPRRDRSLDAVLLLARPNAGRLIRPQLSFHQGHDLNIYASSQLYDGIPDAVNNRDLDGTVIPVISTSLRPESESSLHALGADAYFLVSMLIQNTMSNLSFSGKSGLITLNRDGKISRSPSWAKFESGELHAVLESEQTQFNPIPLAPTSAPATNSAENGYFDRTTSRGNRQTIP